jgi:hypothetical protein
MFEEEGADFRGLESGECGLGPCLGQKRGDSRQAFLPGTFESTVGDERSKAGAAVDEAIPFEFLVSAFDRDDAYPGLCGELADGGERGARGELTVGESGVDAGDVVFVEGARGGEGKRGEE